MKRWIERIRSIAVNRNVPVSVPYDLLRCETVSIGKRLTQQRSFKAYDPVEAMRPYRCSDFLLENLILAGVTSSLVPGKVSLNSLNAADHMQTVMDEFSDVSLNED